MSTILIPEVGLSHDGSLACALGYLDWLADLYTRLGVEDAQRIVKFQCHLAAEETWQQWRVGPRPAAYRTLSRRAYLRQTAFTREQWRQLSEHAHEQRLAFWCSVFAANTVLWLSGLVDVWKVPHTRATDPAIAAAITQTQMPRVVSVPEWALAEANALHGDTARYLWCGTTNPTDPALVDRWLQALSLQPDAGLSLHLQPDAFVARVPAILAARVPLVELHICYSRHIDLPDTPWSLELSEFEAVLAQCQEAG